MSRINILTIAGAIAAVVAAVLPFAMVGRVRITGPAFAPVQVGVALAGALVAFAAILVIHSRTAGVSRLLAFGLAATGLCQLGCATTLAIAFLMPPPYERMLGLLMLTFVLAVVTAVLAVTFAFVLRTGK